MLVTAMSFNPLELIRSCAHEALHSLLDVLEPQARLGLVMVLLEVSFGAGQRGDVGGSRSSGAWQGFGDCCVNP